MTSDENYDMIINAYIQTYILGDTDGDTREAMNKALEKEDVDIISNDETVTIAGEDYCLIEYKNKDSEGTTVSAWLSRAFDGKIYSFQCYYEPDNRAAVFSELKNQFTEYEK
jgi:hypothetical protein